MEGYTEYLAESAYKVINRKAFSNVLIQGATGIGGFPYTLLADGATIVTHYRDMLFKIRDIYKVRNVDDHIASGLILGMSRELLFDIAFDKVLGCVPILGIYCNAMCAKALTWRLGMVFTILSARGESINYSNVKSVIKLIRITFPQDENYDFARPTPGDFKRLIHMSENCTREEFERRVENVEAYHEAYNYENR